MGSVWLIASGKGGVGKSTLCASLAAALSRQGADVCIVDADIGLRSQDALLGVEDRVVYDLMDVARKGCAVRQALISLPNEDNVSLMAASQFARAKDLEPKAFTRVIRELRGEFGFVLIDAPAGIERNLRILTQCEPDETVCVLTPDDVCLRDAARLCEVFADRKLPTPRVIVNRLQEDLIRLGEMRGAQACADRLGLRLLGEVPEDPSVYRAQLNRIRLTDIDCEARRAVERIAGRMRGKEIPLPRYGAGKLSWWKRRRLRSLKEV